jgi:hypothetical protein
LYFSTVTPPAAADACKNSNGARIWGMHYITPRDGEGSAASPSDRTVGGAPTKTISDLNTVVANAQFVTDTTLLGSSADKQAVIYGVVVSQVPTCYQTDTVSDPYFGNMTQVSNVNPGKYELLFQTGSKGVGTGGVATAAGPNAASVPIKSNTAPSRVEGWASIVE